MAFNTTAVDLPGAMLVFVASALGGLRWALTHSLMIKQELGLTNPFATIFWITPVMAVTLAAVSMAEDGWGNVFSSDFFAPDRILVTCILIIIPGLLAFSMVASEY
jgi:solute carrier family 35 protein C2